MREPRPAPAPHLVKFTEDEDMDQQGIDQVHHHMHNQMAMGFNAMKEQQLAVTTIDRT